jgi:hypothetical protein
VRCPNKVSEKEVGNLPRHQSELERSPKRHFAREVIKYSRREVELERNLEGYFAEEVTNKFDQNLSLLFTLLITVFV